MLWRSFTEAAMSSRRLVLAGMVGVLLVPAMARAWWNDEWKGRKPLRIDTSAAGADVADAIGPTPVLVRLHAGNFRFEAAKEDGSDLRFVAGDDKTPLKHHVEKYDALLGEALIWVGLPELKPGAKTEIWLYYGNPKAAPAEDAKGTYDPGMALVYHFAERGQPPRDATASGNHARTAGASTDAALIGGGLRLDGATSVSIPPSPSLAWTAAARMTWSAWVKPADAAATGVLFGRRDGARRFAVGFDAGRPYVEVDAGSGPRRADAAAVAAGGWHHLAVTAGEAIALYVDGKPAAKLAAALPALDTPALLGVEDPADASGKRAEGRPRGSGAEGNPRAAFLGELDELQISRIERPAGFIRVAAASQGTEPGKLLATGQDEESGGAGGGYFAVIIKSVTLDGWVVIGLLAVMGLVSWIVMATKALQLGAVERANERFSARFRDLSGELAAVVAAGEESPFGEEPLLRSSPMYRIYRIGAEETRKRTGGGRTLSAEAIEAIRASLDAGLVREGQRISRRMVFLTLAISGGPFLGLLGTVVGVMITFAAIAAAGDVNVNAIAPGIAAALVATVAGLGVAIPALFGYNWLLTRIKDATATHQVFVDELVTKLAEVHARAEPTPGLRSGERNGSSKLEALVERALASCAE
jgi:biopolymer transport protein ExbB